MKVVCGNTFLLRRPGDSRYHLWIVVTDPSGAPPEVVIVSVTTQRRHSDTTVVLSPADHPFIQHPSVVHFTDAMRIRVERLTDAVLQGNAHMKDNTSENLLTMIREGLLRSPYTVNAMRDYCAARF